jgi:hypothetical protein
VLLLETIILHTVKPEVDIDKLKTPAERNFALPVAVNNVFTLISD